jgi:hypothetical protein
MLSRYRDARTNHLAWIETQNAKWQQWQLDAEKALGSDNRQLSQQDQTV